MARGNKGEKGKPIQGRPANRDPNSGAVVFDDPQGYQRAVKRKRAGRFKKEQALLVATQTKKVNTLEKQLAKAIKDIKKLQKDVGNQGGGPPQ